jgi:rhamnose utilization protein RhaD (predicted bifunctional aldolase and dehydrogenase)
MNSTREDKTSALLALSHNLGSASRFLAILGEGNTSARLSDETFLVKASGSSLGTMKADDLVECRFAPLLHMLDREDFSDVQIEAELFASRVDVQARKPSVEAVFHAYLLSLPGANFIGHTHAESINSLLCSPRADEFATRRIFPDEIVCCGPASVLVPYIDPGVKLARAIRDNVEQYRARFDTSPRVILLQNHGVITLGATPQAVEAAMFMADKAARIFLGGIVAGGPKFLSSEDVTRIGSRIDEHYRQRALQI